MTATAINLTAKKFDCSPKAVRAHFRRLGYSADKYLKFTAAKMYSILANGVKAK